MDVVLNYQRISTNSSLISALRGEIVDISNSIPPDLSGEIAILQDQINDLSSEIINLTNEVDSNTAQISLNTGAIGVNTSDITTKQDIIDNNSVIELNELTAFAITTDELGTGLLNMTPTGSINFVSSGTASGNLNFYNPTNQLEVQQLNYGVITGIGTQLSTLSSSVTNLATGKQDLLVAGTGIAITNNIISTTGGDPIVLRVIYNSNQYVTQISPSRIMFNYIYFNNGFAYDTSTYTATILTDGYYLMTACAGGSTQNSNQGAVVIRVIRPDRNYQIARSQYKNIATPFQHSTSGTFYCEAGDQVYASLDSGAILLTSRAGNFTDLSQQYDHLTISKIN